MYHTWVGSGLTCKYETNLKKLSRDKHSSLFICSVGADEKRFITSDFQNVHVDDVSDRRVGGE
jgi:hypothetical protein